MRALRESSAIASADRLVRLVERARARGDGARHKAERTNSPRTLRLGSVLAILAAVAVVGVMAGASYAMVLSEQTVSQTAGAYAGSSSASPNFPNTPALALGTSPGACSAAGPYAYPAGSANNYVERIVIGVAGASACASGDVAEILTFASPATTTAEAVDLALASEWGASNATWTSTVVLNVTAGTVPSGSPDPTLELVLDYGSTVPPTITSLTAIVT